jgi:hypothetical protein
MIMGYRSEVFMVIAADDPEKGEEQMKGFYSLLDARGLDLDEHWSPKEYSRQADLFAFHAGDVKWYSSYPEVQDIEWIYDMAEGLHEDEDHQISGKFIRIGEDRTDIEERTFGDEWLDMGEVQVKLDYPYELFRG